MKENFTEEEWAMLKALSFIAFGIVASADGKIDDKEAGEMTRRLQTGAQGYKDPLHKELAMDILRSDIPAVIASAKNVELSKVRALLQDKLTQDEYQGFLGSIFVDMLAVAGVSGGFLGRGKIDSKEMTALNSFAALFGIDIGALKRRFAD